MVPTMAIEIRDAIAQDLPRIIEIERLAFPTPWSLKSFERELTLPFSRITIARVLNSEVEPPFHRVAGFLCRWLVADECHILNIAVHPDLRRHGVGMFLMNATLAEAISKQASCVTLEVRRANVAARQLYRNLKFEERRLRRHYYGPGEDAIVMELQLPTLLK
jgi:ribosomal-protein-alanine N-acetyltransferase